MGRVFLAVTFGLLLAPAMSSLAAMPEGRESPPARPVLTLEPRPENWTLSPWTLLNVKGSVSRDVPGIDILVVHVRENGELVWASSSTEQLRDNNRFTAQLHPPGPKGWPAGTLRIIVRPIGMNHITAQQEITVEADGPRKPMIMKFPTSSGVEVDFNDSIPRGVVPAGQSFIVRGAVSKQAGLKLQASKYVNCGLRVIRQDGVEDRRVQTGYVVLLPQADGGWWFEGQETAPEEEGEYILEVVPYTTTGEADPILQRAKLTVTGISTHNLRRESVGCDTEASEQKE